MKKILMYLAILPISKLQAQVDLINIPVGGKMHLYELKGKKLDYIKCNRALEKPLLQALSCLDKHPESLPMTYHGCYNPRTIAGSNKISLHTFGRAIDLNIHIGVDENIVRCFEKAGFTWGGRWQGKQYDPMHFQLDK